MINFKNILILLFLCGFICIIVGVLNSYKQCPPPQIEYRFIPRTFREEQENPVPLLAIYGDMFEKPSPWVQSFNIHLDRDKYDVNLQRFDVY